MRTLVLMLALLAAAVPSSLWAQGAAEPQDPYNQAITITPRPDGHIDVQKEPLPPSAVPAASPASSGSRSITGAPAPKPAVVDPKVTEAVRAAPRDARIRVLVTFAGGESVPKLPRVDTSKPDADPANASATARSKSVAQAIGDRRRVDFASHLATFNTLRGSTARIVESWFLTNTALVELPAANIVDLAREPGVVRIDLGNPGLYTPADTNSRNDVIEGRWQMVSDPYYDFFPLLSGGSVAILDTGVSTSHRMLQGAIRFAGDCTTADPTCRTGNPQDDCANHGTSSAGIIAGNSALGSRFRGVTRALVDSFNILTHTTDGALTCTGTTSTGSILRAANNAVLLGSKVMMFGVAARTPDPAGPLAAAANAAFDAGLVVIAPVGNDGPGAATVGSPADAHRVLTIGAYDVRTTPRTTYANQSRGPTIDGRTKPDIQFPTNAETAATNKCALNVIGCGRDDSALRPDTGTSGSVPFAAGMALMVRNFLQIAGGVTDPGFTYAWILSHGGEDSGGVNNVVGAGTYVGSAPAERPSGYHIGKVCVTTPGQSIPIPVTGLTGHIDPNQLGNVQRTVNAAIWWPEGPFAPHNDLDLRVITPNGEAYFEASTGTGTVFEKVRVPIGYAVTGVTGDFALAVHAYNLLNRPVACATNPTTGAAVFGQPVYYEWDWQ